MTVDGVQKGDQHPEGEQQVAVEKSMEVLAHNGWVSLK
jgi:hypothetical protein